MRRILIHVQRRDSIGHRKNRRKLGSPFGFPHPNWYEQRLFFIDDETAMQLHVPPSQHVRLAKTALGETLTTRV
jgi:hypothetical protein